MLAEVIDALHANQTHIMIALGVEVAPVALASTLSPLELRWQAGGILVFALQAKNR